MLVSVRCVMCLLLDVGCSVFVVLVFCVCGVSFFVRCSLSRVCRAVCALLFVVRCVLSFGVLCVDVCVLFVVRCVLSFGVICGLMRVASCLLLVCCSLFVVCGLWFVV